MQRLDLVVITLDFPKTAHIKRKYLPAGDPGNDNSAGVLKVS